MFENQDELENSGIAPEYLISWKLLNENRIMSLSHGEVKEAETLNYRSLKPVLNGILGENIFGPVNSFECRCGKYKEKRYRGVICERCGVTIEDSSVRREWFGHIDLGCKVIWPMFLKGNPSVLALVLDISQPLLMQIVYGDYVVDVEHYWSVGDDKSKAVLQPKDIKGYKDSFIAGIDAIDTVLSDMDLEEEIRDLEYVVQEEEGYLSIADRHRLEVLKSFVEQGIDPRDMLTSKILVLPAALRPVMPYQGKILCSDINHNYLSIINRKKRLERFVEMQTPELLLRFQKRLIQQAVNNLFDNSFYSDEENKETGTLWGIVKKETKKYLDYSGVSTVIPNGNISIETIALPEGILFELYKPFLISELVDIGRYHNVVSARKAVENRSAEATEGLVSLIDGKYILVENEKNLCFVGLKVVISPDPLAYLHPYTYNYMGLKMDEADSVKIYVPLSDNACEEVKEKLGLVNNLVSSYTGRLQLVPDNVSVENIVNASHICDAEQPVYCISRGEAFLKEDQGLIDKQSKVWIRTNTGNGFVYDEETSVGRILLNECLPQDLGRISRKSLRNKYLLEFNCEFTKESFLQLLEEVYDKKGGKDYIGTLDALYKRFSALYLTSEPCYTTDSVSKKHKPRANSMVNEYQAAFANIKIADIDNEDYNRVHLDFKNGKLHPFVYALLLNKVLVSDAYVDGELRYKEGTVLTHGVLDDLDDNLQSLEIYKLVLKDNCISVRGYGNRPIKSGLQSFQAFRETLGALSELGEARNFISILYGREPIMLTDMFMECFHQVEIPSQFKRSFMGLMKEEQYLYLDELKKVKRDDQYFIKAFACYVILLGAHIQIDFRHIELWISLFEQIEEHSTKSPFNINSNYSLETLAEMAVCGGVQSSRERILTTRYGMLNFESSHENVSRHDSVFNMDKSDEDDVFDMEDDDLLEVDDEIDFDIWDEE